MMSREEEEIQNRVISGDITANDPDAIAYRLVFMALQKETVGELPSGFAAGIVQRLRVRAIRREKIWERSLIISASLVIFAGLTYALFTVQLSRITIDFTWGAFSFLSSYSGLIGFAAVFIVLLHFIDRRLLRHIRHQ